MFSFDTEPFVPKWYSIDQAQLHSVVLEILKNISDFKRKKKMCTEYIRFRNPQLNFDLKKKNVRIIENTHLLAECSFSK